MQKDIRTYNSLIFCCVVWLSGLSHFCNAQLNTTVFEDFNQTVVNPYIINPSATDSSYTFQIRANHINELGVIKNVNRFYIDGDKRFRSSRDNEFHFIGLQATNTKLGDYISKSRLQLRYSFFSRLSKNAFLSSGVSLGFINIAFLTTQGGTGGSDYGPDGSVGIHYLRKNFSFGVAVQQIFTPVLIPVNQSFRLERLYNFDISRSFEIGPFSTLHTFAVTQINGEGSLAFNLGLLSSISDIALIGVNTFSFEKSSVNAGIKSIKIFETEIMLLVTYSFYHNTIPLPNNTLEIFIALRK